MSQIKKILFSIILSITIILTLPINTVSVKAMDSFPFVLLNDYRKTVDIGNEFYIIAITSNGKIPSFKSNNSKVATVNTYGKVTAKKAGTATITAKIKDAEASCKVTVSKTKVSISQTNLSIERGETIQLTAETSNQSEVIWKSNKKSVAKVDELGNLTAVKPGEAEITATADGTSVICNIKVKSPTIKLSKTKATLYRKQSVQLSAEVSSKVNPSWKTNKKSVATVDEGGNVTAVKHGTAIITATVDGVTKSCEIVVKQPLISLKLEEVTLKKGESAVLTAKVSSGIPPVWSTSNPNIAVIDDSGRITAMQKGKAYYYASEDGIKIRGTIYVTE